MKTRTKPKPSHALLAALCHALTEKKAGDLRVLDISGLSSITDHLVMATGTSEPHLRALRIEIERVLKESGTRLVGRDASQESGWTVLDAFDVMIHLFTAETRDRYGLENLWRDAPEVVVAQLLAPATKAAPRAKAKAKVKAKAKPPARKKT